MFVSATGICNALYPDEVEGPQGAVPVDAFETADGVEVAGIAEGAA